MAISTPTVFVSSSTGTLPGASTTYTATTTQNIPAGSLAIIGAVLGTNTASTTTTAVSDGTNTYIKAVSKSNLNSDGSLWYKENATAVSSGATVTITLSNAGGGSNNDASITGYFVTGTRPSSSIDQTASNAANSGSSITATTPTLTFTPSFVAGLSRIAGGTPTYTEPTGFTNSTNQTCAGDENVNLDYQITNSSTAIAYNPSWGSSLNSPIACVANFKAIPIQFNLPMLGM